MQNKGLYSLVGVTVLAVVLAVVVSRTAGVQPDPLAGKAVLPEVAARLGDIGRMALVHADQRARIVQPQIPARHHRHGAAVCLRLWRGVRHHPTIATDHTGVA